MWLLSRSWNGFHAKSRQFSDFSNRRTGHILRVASAKPLLPRALDDGFEIKLVPTWPNAGVRYFDQHLGPVDIMFESVAGFALRDWSAWQSGHETAAIQKPATESVFVKSNHAMIDWSIEITENWSIAITIANR